MSQFKITRSQREQLLCDGYVSIPRSLPDDILSYWQQLANRLHDEAIAAHTMGEQPAHACVLEGANGPLAIRVDDIHSVDPEAVLQLLSCPALIAVARDICGRGAVPLQLDILFKHAGPESVIPWHQGAPHPRSFPYLNVGIYLDDADEGDGCLRYIPGTQHELQDIAGLSEQYGWAIPGVVEQPAKAGDILVQDMMVLHGSQVKQLPGVRRTIYLELRPADGINESAAQSAGWAELRKRWMALVLRRCEPGEWPDQWLEDYPSNCCDDADEFAAIVAANEPPIPAVYATHPVRAPGYPFPNTK